MALPHAILVLVALGVVRAGPPDPPTAPSAPSAPFVIGSKQFTESVILGEIVRLAGEALGLPAEHRKELGGTRILFSALVRGDIALYPEYTGTIAKEILAGEDVSDPAAMRAALSARGVVMSSPLGFENTYALGMRRERAAALGIRTISDLARHPALRLRFSAEFLDRGDGWASLAKAYGLPQTDVRGLDHDLAYRGLMADDADVLDLYSTDAEIRYYDLAVLADDRHHFPKYDAVLLYRADAPPAWRDVAERLAGTITEARMIEMNAAAKLERRPESAIAAAFVAEALGRAVTTRLESRADRLLRHTAEHLVLVGLALALAALVGIPLGVLASRRPRLGQLLLAFVGVLQTIPSLALLVFMIPLLGIGTAPAIAALFLYGLLPIVRNTHAGLEQIPKPLLEAAEALGLPPAATLFRIELPLASPSILAGIKTSAVIAVGTATLGALIGAGGYGEPILTGIRLDDTSLLLEGAIPAAVLALIVQAGFELLGRRLVPKGLRR